jgi:hypothetical protein
MSVILECQPGDEFVCIQAFHASPDGESFSWDTSRKFRPGDRLRYVECRQNTQFSGRPNEWMVVFEAGDNKRYSATQTYFVTTECWKGIKQFFARRLLRESGRKHLRRGS